MYIKLVLSIVLLSVVPFCSYGQYESDLTADMVNNLTVHNSKSVIIPGDHGVLNVYFEKSKVKKKAIQTMELTYNGIKSSFQIGTNIAITQNERLVFAQKDNKIYVHAHSNCKEDLKIRIGYFEYGYHKDYVSVKYKDKEFKFNEAVYDKSKSSFYIYDNGKYIKTVAIEK